MKKLELALVVLFLLPLGKSFAQDNKQLIRYDEKVFDKVADAVKQEDYNNMKVWAKEVLRQYMENQKVQVSFTESDFKTANDSLAYYKKQSQNLKNEKAKLTADLSDANKKASKQKHINDSVQGELNDQIKNLNTQLKSYESLNTTLAEKDATITAKEETIKSKDEQIKGLNGQIVALNADIKGKDNTISGLQAQNKSLQESINQYQKVFEDTKKAIEGIYKENLNKPIKEMDASRLEQAQGSFNAMRTLMQIVDPKLTSELEQKVNEINQWKTLIEPVKGAIEYMKGKYDNNLRKGWLSKLEKVKLTGSKKAEIDNVILVLKDQELIKERYDMIVNELNKKGCLTDTDQLEEAKSMVKRMTGYVKEYYHPNCYLKYDEALNLINKELGKPAPNAKLNSDNFDSFISQLKEMF